MAVNEKDSSVLQDKRPLPREARVQFFELLSVILNAGIPTVRALSILEEQGDDERLRNFCRSLRLSVERGSSLSDALALVGQEKLTRFQIAMMKLADDSGSTEQICQALAAEDEASWRTQQRLKGTLVYPVFVLVLVTTFLLVILPLVVFPQYLQMIEGLHVAETGILKPVLQFMRWTQGPWFWLSLLAAAAVSWGMVYAKRFRNAILRSLLTGIFGKRKRHPDAKLAPEDLLKLEDEFLMETLEVICMKYLTPIGRFLQMVWMIRFFRALEIVLLTGCKLERGLGLSFDCSGSCLMASDGPSMIRQLKDGEPLSAALSMSDVFPRMALEMVAVGEASGMVPALCRRYADGQESMLEQCSRDALTLMEPILVGLMGLIVGAIILLTLYPIVEVIRSL